MKENKIDIEPAQLVGLASSLAICLAQKLSLDDLVTLRQFLSCLCSNLALFEFQYNRRMKGKDK